MADYSFLTRSKLFETVERLYQSILNKDILFHSCMEQNYTEKGIGIAKFVFFSRMHLVLFWSSTFYLGSYLVTYRLSLQCTVHLIENFIQLQTIHWKKECCVLCSIFQIPTKIYSDGFKGSFRAFLSNRFFSTTNPQFCFDPTPNPKWHDDQRRINEAGKCIREHTAFEVALEFRRATRLCE